MRRRSIKVSWSPIIKLLGSAGVTQAYEHALLASATVAVPSNPFSHTFTANGSGIQGDGSQVTQSLSGVLRITTNGRASPPANPARTPAETEAKSNALQALKQTLPAALYPCVTLAAGSTLVAPTPLGLTVGGALVAIGGKLCIDYYQTILAEVATVKDPPRSDFNLLASAAPAVAAASPASRLLAGAGATRSAAEAIAATLARESGARRAHNRAAAALQDRHLKALNVLFRRRRAAEVAAGRAVAAQIQAAGSDPTLGAAQVRAAQSALLARLARHGLSKPNARFVRGLLRSGALDVRSTLGR